VIKRGTGTHGQKSAGLSEKKRKANLENWMNDQGPNRRGKSSKKSRGHWRGGKRKREGEGTGLPSV